MSAFERLGAGIQSLLPQHALTAVVYWFMRIRVRWFKNLQIRAFARIAGINREEAASRDLADYPCFNAFFTRALRDGVRPLRQDPRIVLSPCDGRVSEIGALDDDRLLQAKGRHYTLGDLLAGDPACEALRGGGFATIYLSPRDYHRVHMPVGGTLERMIHVPGRLFSVAPYTVRHVPELFARNERVVSVFSTDAGPFALVLVGAMLVGSMETTWAGQVTPSRNREVAVTNYADDAPVLAQGEEMGRFNMGSTVILVFPPGYTTWEEDLLPGDAVMLGERIGRR
jgi:phosphatidylserine decarboxylase